MLFLTLAGGMATVVDGTATVADVKPHVMNHVGRCYAKVADGIATHHCKGLCYFKLSSEVLNRTSSKLRQMVLASVLI